MNYPLLAFSSRFKTAGFSARAKALPERPVREIEPRPSPTGPVWRDAGSIATPHENYLNENFQ
jgi:hypothetical protein